MLLTVLLVSFFFATYNDLSVLQPLIPTFFYMGFLSWTITVHWTVGEEKYFIPPSHFQSLTDIKTFVCSYAT